jgi:hypothetical protein
LVTISDADVLFLANWQRETYQVFESFPKAGSVSPCPNSRLLKYYTANILFDKLFSKSKEVKVYNLSKNGAYFEGSIKKRTNVLKIDLFKDVSNIVIEYKKELNKYSREGLLKVNINNIKGEVYFFENNLQTILNNIEKKKFSNIEEFLLEILTIGSVLREKKYFYFDLIFYNYLNIYGPYILYTFNDKKLKFKNKKIEEIKFTSLRQIKKIIDDYIICLKRVI